MSCFWKIIGGFVMAFGILGAGSTIVCGEGFAALLCIGIAIGGGIIIFKA